MEIPREEIREANRVITSVPKFVHFRDVNTQIDEHNYQICTKVDFTPVKNDYENIMEMWGRLKHYYRDRITTEHESNPRSGSKYFATEDGYVYRLSDHWGIAKTCLWTRAGEGNMIASLHIDGPIEIGRAHLSEFTIHKPKEEYEGSQHNVMNPEWIEVMLPLVDLANRLYKLKHSPEFNDLPSDDKWFVGSSWGRLDKHLKSIENLEYSKKEHIFVV